MDIFKSTENNFYIELREERYYFPGQDISGDVILDLKKSTKTNNIKVILEGLVDLCGNTIALFSKSLLIALSPNNEKSYYLEPYTHRFPFKLTIPSNKDYNVPSTLEIPNILKVNYRLVAIHQRPTFTIDKIIPNAVLPVNILEEINVESPMYFGEYKVVRDLVLTGETSKVKVSTIIKKRAAVKGDVVPINITIEHFGGFVRDKAITIQLLRSVYYGKNKNELFGPKVIRQIVTNIDILGPINFTKSFDMQLPIPNILCPSVDKSGKGFKIEYTLHVSINLNEQNPLHPDSQGDIIQLTLPFTIGTIPKVPFSIDDDDDYNEVAHINQEDARSNHSSEYALIAENMKNLDLVTEAVPSEIIQEPEQPADRNKQLPLTPQSSGSPSPTTINTTNSVFYKPDSASPITTKTPSYQKPAAKSPTTLLPAENQFTPLERLPLMDDGSVSPPRTDKTTSKVNRPTSYLSPRKNASPPLATTTPLPENQYLPYPLPRSSSPSPMPTYDIRPDIYADYHPALFPVPPSPSMSVPASPTNRPNSGITASASDSNIGTLGRQDSVHWVVRNQTDIAPTIEDLPNTCKLSPNIAPHHRTSPPTVKQPYTPNTNNSPYISTPPIPPVSVFPHSPHINNQTPPVSIPCTNPQQQPPLFPQASAYEGYTNGNLNYNLTMPMPGYNQSDSNYSYNRPSHPSTSYYGNHLAPAVPPPTGNNGYNSSNNHTHQHNHGFSQYHYPPSQNSTANSMPMPDFSSYSDRPPYYG